MSFDQESKLLEEYVSEVNSLKNLDSKLLLRNQSYAPEYFFLKSTRFLQFGNFSWHNCIFHEIGGLTQEKQVLRY